MDQIKVSEIFYSLQGEGFYTGVPSVFLRTFGCNLRCPSFGLPCGVKTSEVSEVIKNISLYKTYNDLPLVSTGCDSYAAVYPEFKDMSPYMSLNDISDRIQQLLPDGTWGDKHLIITGGEPLLGWQKLYPDLMSLPFMSKCMHVTFETNGTQELGKELKEYINFAYKKGVQFVFSVSPKLSCSGEPREKTIHPAIVEEYHRYGMVYLKFVIATEQDADEAQEVIKLFRLGGFVGYIYLMPVGGVESVYHLNNKRVAELALKHGLRYSDRLQVQLWKNAWNS